MQSQFTDKAQNALAQASRCARSLKQTTDSFILK